MGDNTGATNTGNNAGDNQPPWMSQLPDDLKNNEALTGFATIGDLGKSYLEIHGKSANSIQIPGDDADDKTRSTFFNRLGRPENPDGYEFTRPELPEGANYDEGMENDFRIEAHKLGLTKTQAEGVYNHFTGQILAANDKIQDQAEQARNKAIDDLKDAWGDNFSENCEIATRAFMEFADDDQKQFFVDSQFGDNPNIIKLFHEIGKKLLDHKIISGEPAGNGTDDKRKTGIDGKPIISYPSME